jgi:hypothetical protein
VLTRDNFERKRLSKIGHDARTASKISTLAGDEVVSISLRDQVLGVWREHGPPRYFAASAPLLRLLLAISDGKVIDIVAQSDAGMVIARVPAR